MHEGQAIFRYLPVTKKTADPSSRNCPCDKNDQTCPDLPVYVVIKPRAIDFYYHGIDPGTDNHVHICLLHLPLSSNLAIKDNLTSVLKSIYNQSYKLGDCYQIKYQYNELAYWNLHAFSADKFSKCKLKQPLNTASVISGIEDNISFCKLLLDFIFDFEHSPVFQNAPSYEEIEIHLKENYYFSAIAAKAQYYYDRESYREGKRDRDSRVIPASKLADSEIQWLNILRQKEASDHFRNDTSCS
ncbi:MAG: hypothetical protein U5R06_02175 [candidate division KSB1 bacterium]|nr:hypothetical protein [candidate division KSB1 bacterium]